MLVCGRVRVTSSLQCCIMLQLCLHRPAAAKKRHRRSLRNIGRAKRRRRARSTVQSKSTLNRCATSHAKESQAFNRKSQCDFSEVITLASDQIFPVFVKMALCIFCYPLSLLSGVHSSVCLRHSPSFESKLGAWNHQTMFCLGICKSPSLRMFKP